MRRIPAISRNSGKVSEAALAEQRRQSNGLEGGIR
jgi:hypothetical protein